MQRTLLAAPAALLLALPAWAQSFPPLDVTEILSPSGVAEDYLIPAADPPGFIRFRVEGADGGDAYAGNNNKCDSPGGRGAVIDATFAVGFDTGELRPGGTLRFLVGRAGEAGDEPTGSGRAGGGGGGGTGVLYRASSSDPWEPLAVAGGGGGAHQKASLGVCGPGSSGGNASLTTAGNPGRNGGAPGGTGGLGGTQNGAFAGAGGGLYGNAYCLDGTDTCIMADGNGLLGYPDGGNGGFHPNSDIPEAGFGGWGCGGGGYGGGGSGGGGGGGYSGGGAPGKNGSQWGGGGGGGSYVDSRALTGYSLFVGDDSMAGGSVEFTPLPLQDGETCDTPYVIADQPVQSFVRNMTRDTAGNQVTVASSCLQGANATPDHWFAYTNESACVRRLTVSATAAVDLFVEVYDACGQAPYDCFQLQSSSQSFEVSVPAGETRLLRVEGEHLGGLTTVAYTLHVDVTYPIDDPDGDGLASCIDNCPSKRNPDQTDSDGDGVGDACDVCPGGFDGADADQDGVPDECDLCPGNDDTRDADLDGVPDACDSCLGDNTLDGDGDGIPDECDTCFADASDCNGNGIGDSCDLAAPSRYEDFTGQGTTLYTLNASAGAAAIEAAQLRLTDGLIAQRVTANFEPVSPLPTDSFVCEFYFRNLAAPGTTGGDGFSFCVFDAGLYAPGELYTETGLGAGAISISFDTFDNGPEINGNHIELLYDGVQAAFTVPTFQIENGKWRKAQVELVAGALSLTVSDPTGLFEQVFQSVPLPNFVPFQARYGFGARSGGAKNETWIDQVRFTDTSGAFSVDMNGNTTLDACEGVAQQVVLGFPANPNVLIPGADPGPMLATTYTTSIDHATFLPDAQFDVLFLGVALTNDELDGLGVVLVDAPILKTFVKPAGSTFSIPIPNDGTLIDVPLVMQGLSVQFGAPAAGGGTEDLFLLTNAITGNITGWHSTL